MSEGSASSNGFSNLLRNSQWAAVSAASLCNRAVLSLVPARRHGRAPRVILYDARVQERGLLSPESSKSRSRIGMVLCEPSVTLQRKMGDTEMGIDSRV